MVKLIIVVPHNDREVDPISVGGRHRLGKI